MLSSGMLRHVTLVKTDVSEERIVSIIRLRIGELGTLAFNQTSVLTRATRHNIPEDYFLQGHDIPNP
jgi:hypothetical protein